MNKNYLYVGLFLIIFIIAGMFFVYKTPGASTTENQPVQISQTSDNIVPSSTPFAATSSAQTNMDTTKLLIQDEMIGTGMEAVNGKKITVNYTGTLINGTKFDSSLNPGRTPFQFTLGAGEVIQGWDQGFNGMKVGGKRRLTIPPSLGYGSSDMGVIPPNSTLIFEVELLKVE